MIKDKLNSQKGVTLTALIVSIIILLILSSVIIKNITSSNKVVAYNNMIADIKLLEDKVLIYFNKYAEIPRTSRTINIIGKEYYEIDLSKLDNITLNYGVEYGSKEELTETSDVYLVNQSLDVYYLKGVDLAGVVRHEN
ncbi:MAG: hypothetical protein IJE59_01525 [Clostridia bacterium]|nr:hypothetical protein [Clostridia bacterium]